MKKFLKYSFAALVAMSAAVFTSCTPEDVVSVNAGAIPSASDYENAIEIITDQETNNVTFNLNAAGVYPVWIFDGKTYSTINGLEKIFTVAGDYQVEVKIANANGVSDGTIVKTFTLNETKFDFSKYYNFLAGETEKQWYVASTEQGHLGCGEPGTDGQNWWSAAPGDKAAWGVYDDVLTFTADGGYTYNPGEGGTTYVNTGCTIFSEYNTNDGNDFMVPVDVQETTYSLDVEGANLFVVLPPQTLAPYIPNDAFYNNGARYRVESMNAKKMVLIADLDGISWRLILTSEEPKADGPAETWADFASEQNLWYGATIVNTTMWWADPNWGTQANPATETLENGIKLTVDAGYTGNQQWQGQLAFETDLPLSASKTYDVSVTITTDNDIKGVTTKLCYVGVDANGDGDKDDAADGDINGDNEPYIVFQTQTDCGAGESTVIKHFNVTSASDIPVAKFVFDFGGAPAGTVIEVTDIIIQEHVEGNGEAPEEPEEPAGPTWVEWASADNLWYNAPIAKTTFWWADPNWAQTADPAYEALENGFKVVADAGYTGTSQWQGQVAFETAELVLTAGELYDVCMTVCPNNDIVGVTTKLCYVGVDANGDGDKDDAAEGDINGDAADYTLFEVRTDCPADEETVITHVGVTPKLDVNPAKLVFDFGGAPAGTEIVVTNIIIQKHVE